ncbi:diphosphate--fructose-6-phosphate 1-phosphotransferase [Sphaerochaeta globosa]|uniref:Pyrophosphate--fructose 6-phosphate 1-phosphotransferase n=1 Tax=Sphaerochaeta globosa (strain ATCC BAA-1886 / DSM 22777 / Buddy) TaxID=158189 RepID=F0RXZ0_SPHGB|nr:diphosphate--fructose-6-phosphate 1-phosphotransferase [Sphaerochaeta globosa]ADY12414.1 phosphofructokinase [Sphaerochaeta globosa str. Buddy]
MHENLLIIHGGAPTAVMNASLYGVIKQAKDSGVCRHVYAARGGTQAVLTEDFIDLLTIDEQTIAQLPHTPASWIGTSRFHVSDDDYAKMVEVLLECNITGVFFNGGNGSMDACGKLARAIKAHPIARSKGIRVVGIPKTIDNDLAITDHAPGFGSAARYLASSVQELSQDVASLPIHVCIIESMGRNAGWLTAAAALAKTEERVGPHLIYVPEVAFDEERFLDEARSLYEKHGGVVVVASEGLRTTEGSPIVKPIFQVGRSVYYGDVSAHLCNLVIQKLGIKARSEKPGILGRCSIAFQSEVDRDEAILAGREAVKALLEGKSEVMVGFERINSEPYLCKTILIPLEQVMLHERTLPIQYVRDAGKIDEAYLAWCKPLIGSPLASFPKREV